MTTQTALKEAAEVLGGQTALARTLGVSAGLVWQWLNGRRPLPPEHCAAIEKATREQGQPISCEELLPDLTWHRDEAGNVYVRMSAA